MNIIKLDATASTNTFLKNLTASHKPSETTVVRADRQTQGRGQMGAKWLATPGKSLTFSLYRPLENFKTTTAFLLSVQVTCSVYEVFKEYDIPKLAIKWPNDIMSDSKKFGGILIENNVQGAFIAETIVGVGINVLQTHFNGLPFATSLYQASGKSIDMEELFKKLINQLDKDLALLNSKNAQQLFDTFDSLLFKKNQVAVFEDEQKHRFNGMIRGVTPEGLLKIEKEDDKVYTFNIKQVKMLLQV